MQLLGFLGQRSNTTLQRNRNRPILRTLCQAPSAALVRAGRARSPIQTNDAPLPTALCAWATRVAHSVARSIAPRQSSPHPNKRRREAIAPRVRRRLSHRPMHLPSDPNTTPFAPRPPRLCETNTAQRRHTTRPPIRRLPPIPDAISTMPSPDSMRPCHGLPAILAISARAFATTATATASFRRPIPPLSHIASDSSAPRRRGRREKDKAVPV